MMTVLTLRELIAASNRKVSEKDQALIAKDLDTQVDYLYNCITDSGFVEKMYIAGDTIIRELKTRTLYSNIDTLFTILNTEVWTPITAWEANQETAWKTAETAIREAIESGDYTKDEQDQNCSYVETAQYLEDSTWQSDKRRELAKTLRECNALWYRQD